MQNLVPLLLLSFLFSCAKKDTESSAGIRRDDDPSALWSVVYQQSFAELVNGAMLDDQGQLWIAHAVIEKPDGAMTSFMEKRDVAGNLLGTQINLGTGVVAGFAPAGDRVLVASLVDGRAIEAESALRLSVRDSSGNELVARKFEDYQFAGEGECSLQSAKRGFWGAHSAQVARLDDKFVLLTYNCFTSRLTLLTQNLDVVWSKIISAPRQGALNLYGREQLVVSQGRIITAGEINAPEIPTFNQAFGENLAAIGGADVLVSVFDALGHRELVQVVGTEQDDLSAAVTATADRLYLAGIRKVERPTSARSFQSDVWLGALDVATKAQLWSRTIEVQDEEDVGALALVGGRYLAIGGSAGWLQVPTWSVVKPGDAFILLTDLDGQVVSRKIWGTDRDDYVKGLVAIEPGRLLAVGVKDGPITHSADTDRNELHRFGFAEMFSLEALLAP